ncbi:hypothetical protein E4N71_04300 [Treponema vincentii]|uniref:hypothetical protein n=1 Tax=Treponema vincentii TaxID=69710 RepID=UPI0020A2ECB5|nr:hypothetical protein [Treponema vincentii]UTC47112.1 hypothetical protein E4N72_11525 [Treponema vincentii]
MKHRCFICFLSAFLLFSACSFNTPSVVLAKKQRIYSYDRQGRLTERLAAFMLLEDDDGRNDYKELTLREDATGLEWPLHRENTVFLQEAGYSKNVQWVGSNKFKYPRHFFPAGQYTLTASDLGGNKVETAFSLQPPQIITALPFEFTLEFEQWTVQITDRVACSSFSLIMLSADLQPLTVYQLQIDDTGRQTGYLQTLQNKPTDARYIQCFGENADQSIGFLSTPIPLP